MNKKEKLNEITGAGGFNIYEAYLQVLGWVGYDRTQLNPRLSLRLSQLANKDLLIFYFNGRKLATLIPYERGAPSRSTDSLPNTPASKRHYQQPQTH